MGLSECGLIKQIIHDPMNERRNYQRWVFLQCHVQIDHPLFRIVVARQTAEFGTGAAASATATAAISRFLGIQLHLEFL